MQIISENVRRRYRRHLSDEAFIHRKFVEKCGFAPNLDRPRMFCEKINWLKLHDLSPLHTLCADKIRVRDYVRARIGPHILIPLEMATYSPRTISPENIKIPKFVIKPNHDYNSVIICIDRENFDWAQTRNILKKKLKKNHYFSNRETAYRDIRPGVVVEKFIGGDDGRPLPDMKIYCFHGRAEIVQTVAGRFVAKQVTIYDRDWRLLPIGRAGKPRAPQPRPDRLAEMLRVAEGLAAPFRFARVDLYEDAGRIWFGEISFYPDAGFSMFEPRTYEYLFGEMLRVP